MATKVGDVAKQLFDDYISARHTQFMVINELWERLLTEELAQHCKITDIQGGQLKVAVDSPCYRQELLLCSDELLKEINRYCPTARIKRIKTILT